jgi:polar amino acid transport system substrate-binding protein
LKQVNQENREFSDMSESEFTINRRAMLQMAAAAGSVPLVEWTAGPAYADTAAPAFANGIVPSSYVGGDGSYAKYVKNGIRLGLIETFPVNFVDKATGKRTGWNTDIVLAALDKCGITKIEFVEGPWESMVPGLQSARFDLLASDVHVTPQRIEIIDFSTPVFWYGDILVVPKGNPAGLTTWESLAGKRIGSALGVPYTDWLSARADLKDHPIYKDNQTAATDIAAGRIDGYIAEDANFTGFLAQNKELPVEIVASYLPHSGLTEWTRFGIRKEDKDFNNVFSRAISEMFIDGTTLAILQKYGLGQRNLFVIPGMK